MATYFPGLWYLTDKTRAARKAAHDHFDTCEECKGAEWCAHGLSLWTAYTERRTRDRIAARAND